MASIGERSGRLYVDFRAGGKRYKEYLGIPDTPANRGRVGSLLKRLEAEITLGTFEYARYFPGSKNAGKFRIQKERQERGAKSPMSLEAFAELWFAEKKVEWSESYTDINRRTLDKHILPRFGDRKVDEITKADILAFRAEIAALPGKGGNTLSGKRINRIIGFLNTILKEAAERFAFEEPGKTIRRVPERKAEVDPFDFGEARQLVERVRQDYRCYLTVRLFTGLRSSEADGLQWDQIDFSRRQIQVRKALVQGKLGPPKTPGSVREVEMCQMVYDALLAHREKAGISDYVFCGRDGQPINNGNFTKRVWYPLLRHLGLRLRRPYQMRHTSATMWLAAGENPEWIARQMGHANTKMLFEVYSRYVPNLTRKDGSAFERLLNQQFNHEATQKTGPGHDSEDGEIRKPPSD